MKLDRRFLISKSACVGGMDWYAAHAEPATVEACIAALKAGKTKYAPTPGIIELRTAIAERYGADYGLKVAPTQVVVSPGGKFSCYLAVLATCSPGDEAIVPAPFWVSYPEMVKLAGALPRIVLADDSTGFKLTPAQLEAAITPKTRLLILNSPSNPTGRFTHARSSRPSSPSC